MPKPKKRNAVTKLVLDEFFTIRGDMSSYTLQYRANSIDDSGNPIKSNTNWYYSSLKQCLEMYLDKSSIGSSSAEEILVKLEEVKKVIKNL
jgi:hypothetical protein